MVLAGTTLRRLERRGFGMLTDGGYLVVRPMRYRGDERVLQRMTELGYPSADTFEVPIRDVGTIVTIVRFDPKGEDERGEAFALFQELMPLIEAAGNRFVAFHPGTAVPDDTATRYAWLLWLNTSQDWVALRAEPQTYFEAKLADEQAKATPDSARMVDYLAQLADILFAKDFRGMGEAHMREALRYLDADAARVPVALQLRVLRALLMEAAQRRNEVELTSMIQRYVLLANAAGVELPDSPVSTGAPSTFSLPGCVNLRFDVLPDGRVENLAALGTPDNDTVFASAKLAAAHWRFFPAVRGGATVRSQREWCYCIVRPEL